MPGGGSALVRLDCVSRLRDRERRDEHVLRELRDPPRIRRPRGSRRPAGRPSSRRAAPFSIASFRVGMVTGAMTGYAVRRYRGEPMTLERAFRRGLERFLSILGAYALLELLIFGLVTLPLLLILVALVAGLSGASSTIALLCGGLILFVVLGVLALFLYIALALYPPAIMMENASAGGGLSRSWQMTRGHRRSLFGAIPVTAILVGGLSIAISIPLGLVGSAGGLIVGALVSVGSGAWVGARGGPGSVTL